MENASNNATPNKTQKSNYYNYNRQRDNPPKPYNDLRDLLNKKRQGNEESISNTPPSEPKYNFLHDPLRDVSDKPVREYYGSRRFYSKDNNYEYRGRGRGRSRGRGRDRGRARGRIFFSSNNKPNYRKDENTNDDSKTDEFVERKSEDSGSQSLPFSQSGSDSQYRPVSQSGSDSQYRPVSQSGPDSQYRPVSQHRPVTQNYNYNKKKYENSKFNSVQQTEKFGENRQKHEATYTGYNKSGHNFSDRKNWNYSPHARYSPHKRNANPVNISVEVAVDTDTRKCTLMTKDIPRTGKKLPDIQKCAEVKCEENWNVEDHYDKEKEVKEINENKEEDADNENKNVSEDKLPDVQIGTEAGCEGNWADEDQYDDEPHEEKQDNETCKHEEKDTANENENVSEEKLSDVQIGVEAGCEGNWADEDQYDDELHEEKEDNETCKHEEKDIDNENKNVSEDKLSDVQIVATVEDKVTGADEVHCNNEPHKEKEVKGTSENKKEDTKNENEITSETAKNTIDLETIKKIEEKQKNKQIKEEN